IRCWRAALEFRYRKSRPYSARTLARTHSQAEDAQGPVHSQASLQVVLPKLGIAAANAAAEPYTGASDVRKSKRRRHPPPLDQRTSRAPGRTARPPGRDCASPGPEPIPAHVANRAAAGEPALRS